MKRESCTLIGEEGRGKWRNSRGMMQGGRSVQQVVGSASVRPDFLSHCNNRWRWKLIFIASQYAIVDQNN